MRKSTLSAQEVAEMDETKQKQTRKSGFKLMSVRDRGHKKLSNGATVLWHTNNPETHSLNGYEITESTIPNGMFGVKFKDEIILFNAEELSKFLRWA